MFGIWQSMKTRSYSAPASSFASASAPLRALSTSHPIDFSMLRATCRLTALSSTISTRAAIDGPRRGAGVAGSLSGSSPIDSLPSTRNSSRCSADLCTGFVRLMLIPSFARSSLDADPAIEVISTIFGVGIAASSRIERVRARPFIPGIDMSMIARLRGRASAAEPRSSARSDGPSVHSTASIPHERRWWIKTVRLVALSSTTAARTPARLPPSMGGGGASTLSASSTGMRSQNLDPVPSSVSNPSSPSISSASWVLMARPSPVPP